MGEIVHYVSHGTPIQADGSQAFAAVCRAAVVAEVSDPAGIVAQLCVLNPTGIFFHDSRADRDHTPGTWHHVHP